jgi:hypothetical protein
MKTGLAALCARNVVGLAAAVTLVGAVSGCSGAARATGASTVSCANYAIHASGRYHDEVWVRVNVSNSASRPAHFSIDVNLSVSPSVAASAPAPIQVTVSGLVPAGTTAELGRKLLTTSLVQRCRITRLSRS